MAMNQTQVTVHNTPTLLITSSESGSEVTIFNAGSAQVFIGGPAVTKTTGLQLSANNNHTIKCYPYTKIYAITANADVPVTVLEMTVAATS